MLINSLRLACIPLTVSSALGWAAASVLAHQSKHDNNDDQNKITKALSNNQYLFGAATFASVAASAFLNLYGGRTLIFLAASLWSLFMHFNKDNLPKNLLNFFDLGIVGFLGLAAASKGFVTHKKAKYEFPQINSVGQLLKAWKENLNVECQVAKDVFQNYAHILSDIPRGLAAPNQNKQISISGFQETIKQKAPNFFQGNFQLTALLRLLAFAAGGIALFNSNQKNNSSQELNLSPENKQEHKKDFWNETSSWLVSISLIPAFFAALVHNPKWHFIPNAIFNFSGLFGLIGFSFKLVSALADSFDNFFQAIGLQNFFKGELSSTIGALCTKLLIVMQMLAYALSQCLPKKH